MSKFFVVAGFNLLCLGVTYYMRGQLDKRAQERAKQREAKAEWDKKSEKEKMSEFNKFFPMVDVTPEKFQEMTKK